MLDRHVDQTVAAGHHEAFDFVSGDGGCESSVGGFSGVAGQVDDLLAIGDCV